MANSNIRAQYIVKCTKSGVAKVFYCRTKSAACQLAEDIFQQGQTTGDIENVRVYRGINLMHTVVAKRTEIN